VILYFISAQLLKGFIKEMTKAFKRNERRTNIRKKWKQARQVSCQNNSLPNEENKDHKDHSSHTPINKDHNDSEKKRYIFYDPAKVG
jgi:hypothetical protein